MWQHQVVPTHLYIHVVEWQQHTYISTRVMAALGFQHTYISTRVATLGASNTLIYPCGCVVTLGAYNTLIYPCVCVATFGASKTLKFHPGDWQHYLISTYLYFH